MNEIADQEYDFIRRIVYDHSRINLGDDKKVLVTSRLAKRLRALNLNGYGDYCRLLKSPTGGEELGNLVDVISTNHTNFFRESKHFEFLQQTVLPDWTPRLAKQCDTFRVWSAASSSGEEPYTIAIVLADYFSKLSGVGWAIEASDISTRILAKAREAIYAQERLVEVKPEWRRRYFQKGVNDWAGHFRVKEELRQRVRFHHLNLLQARYPFISPFHVIFCRNVMIYFDRPTQESLVAKLTEQLAPGGYLLVGHSESLSGIQHTLRMVQPATYVKATK